MNSWSSVRDSVLFDSVQVGRNATVSGAILDKNVVVPDGVHIGIDREADEARGYYVSERGVTVVPKGVEVKPI